MHQLCDSTAGLSPDLRQPRRDARTSLFSGSTLVTLADELEGYDMTKSSLHFDPAEPLPATLVRKLIKARIAET